MTRLTDTQTTLLSTAAARKNGSLLPAPESLKASGKPLERALATLVKHGFAAETRARSEAATWRRDDDGTRTGLVVTAAGLAAIGVEEAKAGSTERQANAGPADAGTALATRPGGKLGGILAAIEAGDGATIGELASAATWQPHTTRAALTRLRQRGFDIRLSTVGDRKAYRLHSAG